LWRDRDVTGRVLADGRFLSRDAADGLIVHTPMRVFLALSLASLIACAAGETKDDTGDTVVAEGGCPAGSGLVADTRKVFAYTDAWEAEQGYSGTWTVEVTEVRDDGAWTSVTEGTYGNDEFQTDVTLTSTGRCDTDGLWLLEDYSETVMAYEGEVVESWSRISYDPGFLVLPAVVGDGIAWDADYAGTRTTEEGTESLVGATYAFDARDAPEIVTPAGTFAGIAVHLDDSESVYQYRDATVGDLGNVEDYELLAY
jgi:hypothetical protein